MSLSRIAIMVTPVSPKVPLRIQENGKTRYNLSLTKDEKAALIFSSSVMKDFAAMDPLVDACIIHTDHPNSDLFDQYRNHEFSPIPADQRKPLHDVVESLWHKIDELFKPICVELNLTDLYQQHLARCEKALQKNAPQNLRGVAFCKMAYLTMSQIIPEEDLPPDL